MRPFFILILIVSLWTGCQRANKSSSSISITLDTIYGGDFIWREKQESKRQVLILDNGIDGERPIFKLNQENLLRIRMKRLFEYETFPSNIHGAEIIKVDTSKNCFLVTPTDTSFSFDINQYYPKGRVIRCTRNWNEGTKGYDQQLTQLNGYKSVTHFEWVIR